MDGQQYENTMFMIRNVARTAMMVSTDDAVEVLNEINRTSAIMPVLDPTGYREISENIPGHTEIVKAFIAFRQALDKVAGRP